MQNLPRINFSLIIYSSCGFMLQDPQSTRHPRYLCSGPLNCLRIRTEISRSTVGDAMQDARGHPAGRRLPRTPLAPAWAEDICSLSIRLMREPSGGASEAPVWRKALLIHLTRALHPSARHGDNLPGPGQEPSPGKCHALLIPLLSAVAADCGNAGPQSDNLGVGGGGVCGSSGVPDWMV